MSTAISTPAGQTGPRTLEGKAISSQNAVKYGIFCQTPYRNEAEKAQWELHRAGYFERFSPVGIPEINLVEGIAHDNFRLIRIRAIEDDIFLRTPETDAPEEVWTAHHKELNNLALYMQRTERLIERSTKSLKELQTERRAAETKALEEAKLLAECAWEEGRLYDHAIDGDPRQAFVFSNDELALAVTRDQRIAGAPKSAKPVFRSRKAA